MRRGSFDPTAPETKARSGSSPAGAEPLEKSLAVHRQHSLYQNPRGRSREDAHGDVPLLPLDLQHVLHRRQRLHDDRRAHAGGQPVDPLPCACRTSRASSTGAQFFTSGSVWPSSKIIHEFERASPPSTLEGKCTRWGMLFLVLTPALYCDVTDSWLLPNKWKRIWISAADKSEDAFWPAWPRLSGARNTSKA